MSVDGIWYNMMLQLEHRTLDIESDKKGFQPAQLVIKRFLVFSEYFHQMGLGKAENSQKKGTRRGEINKFSSIFGRENLFVFLLLLSHSIVPNRTPFAFSRLTSKIYSETFISSKNPTEWSFTWITFNNNPSLFRSLSLPRFPFILQSPSRLLYQLTKYLFIARSSQLVLNTDVPLLSISFLNISGT